VGPVQVRPVVDDHGRPRGEDLPGRALPERQAPPEPTRAPVVDDRRAAAPGAVDDRDAARDRAQQAPGADQQAPQERVDAEIAVHVGDGDVEPEPAAGVAHGEDVHGRTAHGGRGEVVDQHRAAAPPPGVESTVDR
jgi:hypothetical protein